MSEPCAATVDVRDMVCAQALALVGAAVRRLHVGQAVDVVYNAADVRRDLLAWAAERGHGVVEAAAGWSEGAGASLRLTRGR